MLTVLYDYLPEIYHHCPNSEIFVFSVKKYNEEDQKNIITLKEGKKLCLAI